MNSKKNEFGAWLRTKRKEAGMSQRVIAPLLRVSHTYVSKIEAGTQAPPGEDTLNLIASVLSINPDDVYRQAGRVPCYIVRAFDRGMSDEVYRQVLIAFAMADGEYRLAIDQYWREPLKLRALEAETRGAR